MLKEKKYLFKYKPERGKDIPYEYILAKGVTGKHARTKIHFPVTYVKKVTDKEYREDKDFYPYVDHIGFF